MKRKRKIKRLPPNRDMFSMPEVAEQLGVTRQRIHQLCEELNVRKVPAGPRIKLLRRRDVERIRTHVIEVRK